MSGKTSTLPVSGMSGTIVGELMIELVHQRPRRRRWRDWCLYQIVSLGRWVTGGMLSDWLTGTPAYRTKADTL